MFKTGPSAALAVNSACACDRTQTFTSGTANVPRVCCLMKHDWADGRDWKERITVHELRTVLGALSWFQARSDGKVTPKVVDALAAVGRGGRVCPRGAQLRLAP